MRATARYFNAAALIAGAVLALFAARGSARTGETDTMDADVTRIRTHLAAVEVELLAADVSRLTTAQRAARARHIAVLREYRLAGVFPHNHTVADRRVPVFVDEHGTHCAVGYLLARDGRADVVERVRRTRNNATVPALADDPDLVAWLVDAGLTLEEAARIQPWYGPIPIEEREPSRAYRNATLVATGLGGVVSLWNLAVSADGNAHGVPGVIGVGTGAAELTLGAVGLIERIGGSERTRADVQPGYIALNFGVGVVTSALGLRNLLRDDDAPARPIGSGAAAARDVQWQLSPWAPAVADGVGVRLDVRF